MPTVPASGSRKRLQIPLFPTFSPSEARALLLCQGWWGAWGAVPWPAATPPLQGCGWSGARAETLHQKANSKKTNTITRQLKCSW